MQELPEEKKKEIKEKGLYYFDYHKFDNIFWDDKYKFHKISTILQIAAEAYINNEMKKDGETFSTNYLEEKFSSYNHLLDIVNNLYKGKKNKSNSTKYNAILKYINQNQR